MPYHLSCVLLVLTVCVVRLEGCEFESFLLPIFSFALSFFLLKA